MIDNYENMLGVLKTFVSKKLGIDKAELTEETKIEEDVGIAGLDTYMFYDDFFVEFQIENPSDFRVDQYMSSDNLELGKIIKSIFSKTQRERLRVKNITIKHLTKVAITKRWVEE